MEEIPPSKRRKIEETVLDIIKNADIETATEYSVRATASQQLGIDLSDLASKICVRQVLESFLLSTAATVPTIISGDVGIGMLSVAQETKPAEIGEAQQDKEAKLSNGNLDSATSKGRVICKLSEKRNVAIQHMRKGQTLVSIRDYYDEDGKQFLSGRGITLTGRQWACLRSSFSTIEEAIVRMQSRIMRSVAAENVALQGSVETVQSRMDTDIPNPANDVDNQSDTTRKRKYESLTSNGLPIIPSSAHEVDIEGLQPHTDACASPSADSPQGHAPNNQLAFSTQSLVPIMTTRFNGKNYHCWRHQMELFLKQLNLAYVLKKSCPIIPREGASFEENMQAEVVAKKWKDDEYICRHSILNSLSDNLFEQYSKKSCNAKELWEELKSAYSEDFGTVRSEVNKYIQFEMVDGVSVLEQVQELNHIANTITASGIWIDENLHVSVIISKLPPSWKEYRAKLMYHEFLPLHLLIHLLKNEEESRKHQKENPPKMVRVVDTKVENRFERKKKEGSRVCYKCGKEGHISKFCPDRKFDGSGRSNGKPTTPGPESREVMANIWRRTTTDG